LSRGGAANFIQAASLPTNTEVVAFYQRLGHDEERVSLGRRLGGGG
jgi:hypothetical protein